MGTTQRTRNITGLEKRVLTLRVKLAVFLHFLPRVLLGRIRLREFYFFLRRLLLFLAHLRSNKFVRLKRRTRFDLYVPGYPSKAFYTACEKFLTFGKKLPNTTVLLSLTSACRFNCRHCYQKLDLGRDVDIDALVAVTKRLQELGVAFFNIEGGDPFLVYDRLRRICQTIDSRSEIWVNSTGDGITEARLRELSEYGLTAVMFSLHSPRVDELNAFMGSEKAWNTMRRGIEICHCTNVPVAINTCLGPAAFSNGCFEELMDTCKDFGAAIVQIIKPKSAGAWLSSGAETFTSEDLGRVKNLVDTYNQSARYSSYPAISAQLVEEGPDMFGCTAGGTDRFYINAKGDVQPCEFLNISFGNIQNEPFDDIYRRMRKAFEIPRNCWLCEKYSPEVLRTMQSRGLDRLPLPSAISQELLESWDMGRKTKLYETIGRLDPTR